jgi:iron complex outermembrane receptor protein
LLYSDVKTSGDNWGVFAQDELKLSQVFSANAGVRYDWYSTFGDTLNPRLALVCAASDTTVFKALYGRAFRAPNAFEYDYVAPGYLANHALQPETVESWELAWEQALGRNYRLTASIFRNNLEDLIVQVVDPGSGDLIYDNVSSARVQGIEAELESWWSGGVKARASYSYSEAVDEATDLWLSNSPRHLAKLNVSAPIVGEHLSAGLELQAMSSRRTEAGNEVGGFVVCNATLLSRELWKGVTLSFSVYNLLDTDYRDPVSQDFVQDAIWQPGRTFRLKLDYRF